MSKVKSVKIWSRKEMTQEMYEFGFKAFEQFKRDVDSETYGDDWKDCAYSLFPLSAWVKLSKSGNVSVMVSI